MKMELFDQFKERGLVQVPLDGLDHIQKFLQVEFDKLENETRPWNYWELHNPWSRSATLMDSWGFLDICQAPALIHVLTRIMGPDIILYDSQFYPDLLTNKRNDWGWHCDLNKCPVNPLSGLVVRIPFGKNRGNDVLKFRRNPQVPPKEISIQGSEQIVIHDIGIEYLSSEETTSKEYVIRYFPGTSHYVRDASSSLQKQLTETHPLINYAKLPLWLVAGEDKSNNDFVTGFNPKAGRWIST